jgi:thiopurine S-methyltransferase
MNTDKSFWNQLYDTQDTRWDIGHVSPAIKDYIDQLQDKSLRILIPGAGNSYEAEYLHSKGFINTYILDISDLAIQNFRQRVPTFPDAQLICGDFFNHKGTYDLIIEQTFFCALDPLLRRKYVKHMTELLAKSGKLVGLLFEAILNEDHPPYGGNREEYKSLFDHSFDIITLEKAYNSIPKRQDNELFINFRRKDIIQ